MGHLVRPFRLCCLVVAVLACGLAPLEAQTATPAPVEAEFDSLAASLGGPAVAQTRIITDNREAWFTRWYLVAHATRTIDCTYFESYDDIYAVSFLGHLLKKATEGVSIRLMLDFRGSSQLLRSPLGQQYLRDLVSTGRVQVRIYNPTFKSILGLVDRPRAVIASNHDKFLIVDGEWLLTGGRNLSHVNLADRQDDPQANHDTDILLRGAPIARDATRAFEAEFTRRSGWTIRPGFLDAWSERKADLEKIRQAMENHMRGLAPIDPTGMVGTPRGLLRELALYPRLKGYDAFVPHSGAVAAPAFVLSKRSLARKCTNDITDGLARLMASAREEILIQSPYVVLTPAGRRMLHEAGRRGVRIALQTTGPEGADSLIPQIPLLLEWKSLLASIPNLRILATQGPALLHSKVFVIDRRVAVIGSYNMDTLSEQVNAEDVVVLKSQDLATRLALKVQEDLSRAYEYKIRVLPDGTIEELQGPADIAPPGLLRALPLMAWVRWLRPIL